MSGKLAAGSGCGQLLCHPGQQTGRDGQKDAGKRGNGGWLN